MPDHFPLNLDIRHIAAGDLQPVSWKNGGGVTREIAAQPSGSTFESFLWRISMADVAADGAFSTFDGIDRVLTMIDGAMMTLVDTAEEVRHTVYPFRPFDFPGETPIRAELPEGPIRDFNLMYRRGFAQGYTNVQRTAGRLGMSAGSMVLHCASGTYRIRIAATSTTYLLHHGDTLVFTLPTPPGCKIDVDIEPLVPGAVLLDSRIRTI